MVYDIEEQKMNPELKSFIIWSRETLKLISETG